MLALSKNFQDGFFVTGCDGVEQSARALTPLRPGLPGKQCSPGRGKEKGNSKKERKSFHHGLHSRNFEDIRTCGTGQV